MGTILIIDDDIELTSLINEFLNNYNFKIEISHNPVEGLKKLEKNEFDLLILDIMLPEMDGFQVLTKIRQTSTIPIIMLTARGKVSDRITGLELGADDYLPKPFEPKELLARIQSIIRRTASPESMVDELKFNDLVINKFKQEVCLDNQLINLSTTEFDALVLFVENPGKTLDREFLVENLRGITWQSYDRSVDVLVSRLRNKLKETPEKTRFIKTIHGVGYKFIGIKSN